MALVTANDDETEDGGSKPRWSAGKKLDVVLRLRGEKLDALSRELGVEAHRIAAWRDDFLSGGKDALRISAVMTWWPSGSDGMLLASSRAWSPPPL